MIDNQNFDLLVNSLIIHYKISPEVEEIIVEALRALFNISEEDKFISVHLLILFSDMISFPKFIQLLELGNLPMY